MQTPRTPLIFSAFLLALGLATAGLFIGNGIAGRNSGNRSISVKGLSEREVPASVAIWTVGYGTTGNDVGTINSKLQQSTKAVIAFLKQSGFEEKEIAVQPPALKDTSMEVRPKDSPPPGALQSQSGRSFAVVEGGFDQACACRRFKSNDE